MSRDTEVRFVYDETTVIVNNEYQKIIVWTNVKEFSCGFLMNLINRLKENKDIDFLDVVKYDIEFERNED